VPARIADTAVVLPSDLAADAEDAAAALARFDSYARDRLGSQSPVLGPMSAITTVMRPLPKPDAIVDALV
jgi:hypothetical protein